MKILILGITGAIGSTLAPELLHAGHEVRGLSRRKPDLGSRPELADVEFFTGDAISGDGLERALRDVDVAYYLIHSMDTQSGTAFVQHESQAAANYAAAARTAGVRRTLYLGGPVPPTPVPSPHLGSRLAVERQLLESTEEALAFRASVVVGVQSRSFRFLVRLIERMPVLPMPAWRNNRSAPIDERDITAFLVNGATAEGIGRQALDVAGPDTVSFGEFIERIRDLMMVSRIGLPLPAALTLTPVAARIVALVTDEDPGFIEPLMESLDSDLLQDGAPAAKLLGVRLHRLNAAIERALREWEQTEELTAR